MSWKEDKKKEIEEFYKKNPDYKRVITSYSEKAAKYKERIAREGLDPLKQNKFLRKAFRNTA